MHPNAAVLSPLVQFLAGLTVVDHRDGTISKTVPPELCKQGCLDFALYNAGCSHDNKECFHKNEAAITKHQGWCLKTTKVCTDLSLHHLSHEDESLAKELKNFAGDQELCWSHGGWSKYCDDGNDECIQKHWNKIQADQDKCVMMRKEVRSDVHSKNSEWKAAHPSSSRAKTHGVHVTLAARAMATPIPDDQKKAPARSGQKGCKCFVKADFHSDICGPNNKNCKKMEGTELTRCITNQQECNKYAQEAKKKHGKTSTVELPPVIDEYIKALQARAGAIDEQWKDLGPVTVRTERPEAADHEIQPRTAEATSTVTGQETFTYTSTMVIDVASVVVVEQDGPPTTSDHEIQPRTAEATTYTTMGQDTITYTSTEVIDVASVVVEQDGPPTTLTSTIFAPTSVTTTVSPTTTLTVTGTPMTTFTNITGGLNTITVPMPSNAPVIVVSGQGESWSTGSTTETIWSSVWEPINTPIATTTKRVIKYIPISKNPSQAANPTGKTSSAAAARSGTGVMIMAGVGALAACFLMF
ncbi:hypothetical protein B0T20DRAFT_397910 [Sordaria brevicollis]|uniref:Extracellular membrane protein CFEM domain-containing protein n=1 Tax=Sordaria brevicollis TaxID=83679 RepID=A0AAE0NVG4_SORBR|nr:hypothetical protein B0T20DRAFT_397910 [Sordaria brevicollis]